MQVDFETKKKMLFECLESAEKSLEGSTLAQTNRDYSFLHNRQQRKRGRDEQVEKFKHKDSLFKRPDLPINKCLRSRQRPDHEVNINGILGFSIVMINVCFRKIQINTNITLWMMFPTPQIA